MVAMAPCWHGRRRRMPTVRGSPGIRFVERWRRRRPQRRRRLGPTAFISSSTPRPGTSGGPCPRSNFGRGDRPRRHPSTPTPPLFAARPCRLGRPTTPPESEADAMKGTLTQKVRRSKPPTEDVLAALAGKQFFWLDLDDGAADGTVGELLSVHFGFHPLAVQAAETFLPTTSHRRLRRLHLHGRPGRRPREDRPGRGALLLDRHLCGHRAPGRLPGPAASVRERMGRHRAADGGLAPDRHRLSRRRCVGREFLPGPQRFRRQDRCPRRRHPQGPDRGTVGRAVRHETQPHEHAQGHHAAAGHDGQHQFRVHGRPRA